MPFAAVLELSSLDRTNGFQINGEVADDRSGGSVASAGDVNGDGIDDLIIGASLADPNGTHSGASYVVFGRSTGFAANLNLSTLNGSNGFQINGEAPEDFSGVSVASAGDVNGDGIDDLIVGASSADPNGTGSGASYVIFGRSTGFAATLELSALDGTTGFKIIGEAAYSSSGRSVAAAGDVNGDGIDDLIVGAFGVSPNGVTYAGASYVVFGRSTGFAATFGLGGLDGSNGFRIIGEAAGDLSGFTVASAGDVNGDGIDDLIIGAYRADPNGTDSGASYVVFGQSTGFAADLDLSVLDGTNGFQINGEAANDYSGRSVASAGDVNGDGIDDLIVGAERADPNGAYSGASYVVFGRSTGFAANLDLSALDGTTGFKISGELAYDFNGNSVASAGDVNGDGIDDLIIGAFDASPYGNSYAGTSYVVFGKSTGFAATLDLGALDGSNGFRINGEVSFDYSGRSVAAAGDVDGDGIDDLIVGAFIADPNGISGSGASYVVFGRPDGQYLTRGAGDDLETGSGLNDYLAGGAGKDTLSGLGGRDILRGGADNDYLLGGDGDDKVSGDTGSDILDGGDGADTLSGGDGSDKLFGGLGADDLVGGLGNDRFDGGADADGLIGGDGNDYLDGGAGADVMTGGLANDVYIVDDAGDQTIEAANQGYDILRTALDGWVLGDNIEGLELQGSADIDGSGNSGANNLQGNGGANTLSGLAGVDTLNGNDGDDIIIGGLGNDLLRGGLGGDTFVVAHAFGATLETDQVYDFSAAEGDILDLSGAYAGTLSLVQAFSKQAGQMTLSFAGGITTLKLDITGDGKVDYQMKINGDVTGESGDWLL